MSVSRVRVGVKRGEGLRGEGDEAAAAAMRWGMRKGKSLESKLKPNRRKESKRWWRWWRWFRSGDVAGCVVEFGDGSDG